MNPSLPTAIGGSTEAGHTPGPWDATKTIHVRGDAVSIGWLCSAEPGSQSDIEARANARLIAAAPELLAALERLVMLTPHAANAFTAHDLHLTVRAIAETAIARATGAA